MNRALAGVCLILLAPLALVDVPPLLDYPNHLARAFVLASVPADPILARMYATRWAIVPNLATDLVLPPLLQLLPVHLAGRIIAGIALLLPVFGTVAYSRATFRQNALWPLASALVAYNATFMLGFLNFVAASGIALLLAAMWITWRERYPLTMIAVAASGTVLLFFCHLMGLLFFFLLLAGYELEHAWAWRSRSVVIAIRLAALLPLVAPPLALYLLSPLAPMAGRTEFLTIAGKAWQLFYPFANYDLPLDIATTGAVGVFLFACAIRRCCRITLGSGITLTMTALLFAVAPWAFKDTYLLDTRFVIMLGFLLFGALLPTGLPRSAALSATTAFTLLFVVRMSVVAIAWYGHRQDLANLRATIAPVEAGATVLAVSVTTDEAPGYWRNAPLSRRLSSGYPLDHHLPALLLIERRAYWPFLFDNPSQQPVETLAPYARLAEQADTFVGHHALATPGKVDLCGFNYVLLLDAGGEPDLADFAADRLALVTSSNIAALFRVRLGACAL